MAQPAAWAPPPPQYAPPQHAPQQHAPQPPTTTWPPQPQPSGLPTWVMGVGIAVGLLLVFGLAYYFVERSGPTNTAEKTGVAAPSAAGSAAADQKVTNPLQKYVEVVGVRMATENKKTVVKFLVVNHSASSVSPFSANVTLWAGTSRSDEDAVGSFTFKAETLEPYGSKELSAPLKTKMKAYEMPDWQNVTAELQISTE